MDKIQKILKHYKKAESTGKALNDIQDIALSVMNEKETDDFLILTNRDAERCEDQDFSLICGDYYDWKQLEIKRDDIIKSFFGYFTRLGNDVYDKVIDALIIADKK